MALDTWLLDQQIAGLQPPTLRFYSWQPVSLSLGYHQRHWPAHWQSLQWQGRAVPLVRRPSGGRAVLHQGDLCYGVTLPLAGQRRQDRYQQICDGLITGWQGLGVPLRYGTAGRGYIHNPSCFGTATAADLVTDQGYKLIGSAQLRRDRSLLQQGSMRLNPDRALTQMVFGMAETWQQPPAFISGWQGKSWDERLDTIMATMVSAIATTLGVTFETRPLSPAEHQMVQTYLPKASPPR